MRHSFQKSQVRNRNIAKPDHWFRIAIGGCKVEPMCDPVGAFAAHGREDRAYSRVTQRFVEVGKPVLILAGQVVTVSVKSVRSYFDNKAPAFYNPSTFGHALPLGCAGRGNKPDAIPSPQPRR